MSWKFFLQLREFCRIVWDRIEVVQGWSRWPPHNTDRSERIERRDEWKLRKCFIHTSTSQVWPRVVATSVCSSEPPSHRPLHPYSTLYNRRQVIPKFRSVIGTCFSFGDVTKMHPTKLFVSFFSRRQSTAWKDDLIFQLHDLAKIFTPPNSSYSTKKWSQFNTRFISATCTVSSLLRYLF